MVAVVFAMAGIVIGYVGTKAYSTLTNAKYNRSGMDDYMATQLGKYTFDDIHSHELLAVAYAYNTQEPRFYSKYFTY